MLTNDSHVVIRCSLDIVKLWMFVNFYDAPLSPFFSRVQRDVVCSNKYVPSATGVPQIWTNFTWYSLILVVWFRAPPRLSLAIFILLVLNLQYRTIGKINWVRFIHNQLSQVRL